MVRRARRAVAARMPPMFAVAAAVVAAGCELAGTNAPEIEARVVVHAVLNPTSGLQTVLVERTFRSALPSPDENPTYEPITNARVVIYGPRNDSAVASRATGVGTIGGVYRVSSITVTDGSAGNPAPNVLRLRPGERYQLRVETSLGVTRGETTIPVGGPVDGVRRTFNLDRDTLRVNTANVRNAGGFYLRHETTNAVHEHYATSLDDALMLPLGGAEEPKWSFAFAHESVFPGVSQRFTVVAVDSNYFRYYVAAADPFGDDTRGNTLTGGVGLFGSVAPLMSKVLDLTANIDLPIEGVWTADRVAATLPVTMTLYSSPSFPAERLGRRLSLTGTGLIAGTSVEVYGSIEGVMTLQFFAVGQAGQASAATGSMTSADLVLTDVVTGERVTYRKR